MPENRQNRQKKGNPTSFKPGQSGNPGGRPAEFADFRKMAREQGAPKAWATLMRNMECGDPGEETKAALGVLAYAWGKPSQAVEVSGPDGKPVETKSEVTHAGPEQAARVLEVLARVGVIPPGSATGSPLPGDDTTAD